MAPQHVYELLFFNGSVVYTCIVLLFFFIFNFNQDAATSLTLKITFPSPSSVDSDYTFHVHRLLDLNTWPSCGTVRWLMCHGISYTILL